MTGRTGIPEANKRVDAVVAPLVRRNERLEKDRGFIAPFIGKTAHSASFFFTVFYSRAMNEHFLRIRRTNDSVLALFTTTISLEPFCTSQLAAERSL
jgi:hypothetical protein